MKHMQILLTISIGRNIESHLDYHFEDVLYLYSRIGALRKDTAKDRIERQQDHASHSLQHYCSRDL